MSVPSKVLVGLALALSLGLHWALLQTVAWTGMLFRYSQQATLAEAIAKTFDGRHPCSLCKVIEQARSSEKQEQKDQPKFPASKLDPAWLAGSWEGCWPPQVGPLVIRDGPAPRERNWEPPKPRPRHRS